MRTASLANTLKKIENQLRSTSAAADFYYPQYRDYPVEFAHDVLKVAFLTPVQKEVLQSLLEPPYRTLVGSGHNVGKTLTAAIAILWWHLTRSPSIVVSTAPKFDQVCKVLWKEVRRLGHGLVNIQPSAPMIKRGVRGDDFAMGTTAGDPTAFHGHHGAELLFVVDEAVGVAQEIMTVIETMFNPPGHAWLCTYNPTDTSSYVYAAEQAVGQNGLPTWNHISMSSVNHPNIAAELAGEPPPIPSAIRLNRLQDMIYQWSDPVMPGTQDATDLEWPPGSGKFLRPGPLAQARLLGIWAASGQGVWTEAAWNAALSPIPTLDPAWRLVIGCDVARYGEDDTTIHVRFGPCSLHHEKHNGWSTSQTAGRLKQLCIEWTAFTNKLRDPRAEPLRPEQVPVQIDDTGVGGGVVDQGKNADGKHFLFIGIGAADRARDFMTYPRKRDELWFDTVKKARAGQIDLSRLDSDTLRRLKAQALAPTYEVTVDGKLRVESKDKLKERIGRSPDCMDSLNLAFLDMPTHQYLAIEKDVEKKSWKAEGGGHFGNR